MNIGEMMQSYSFKPKKFGVTYDEICRFNTFNKLITEYVPGWTKNGGTVYIKDTTIPIIFFGLFIDIGKIRMTKALQIPEPERIK
jgi:hypothetical protein